MRLSREASASRRRTICFFSTGDSAIAQEKAPRINGEINSPEIRLVGDDGEQFGIVPLAEAVATRLKAAGFRAATDLRNEKITYKIREHSLQKLPYQLIVGDREQQADTVAVRTRGGEDLGGLSLDDLVSRFRDQVASHG